MAAKPEPASDKPRSGRAAASALARFETDFAKAFGVGSLRKVTEMVPYEVVSTGSLALDIALGVGGLVEGRLAEIWGPDHVGKTTLACMMIAEAQRKYPDKQAAVIDMEHKFDLPWAVAHGVDLSRLYLYPPTSAEDVADAMKKMCASGLFSIIVLDSVGAMIPEAEKEKDSDEEVVAKQAKIVTRMVKINAVEADRTGTVIVLINQVRANVSSYGAATTTAGGFALKHVTTMKLKVRRTDTQPFKVTLGGEQRIVGHEIAVTVERNTVAPAYRTAILTLINVPTEKYGPIGVDKADEATTIGLKAGVVQQNGGWYTLPKTGERVQGRDKVVEALRADPDLVEHIRTTVLVLNVEAKEDEEPPATGKPNFRKGAPEDVS